MAKARIGLKLDRPSIGAMMVSSELGAYLGDVAEIIANSAGGDGYSVVTDFDRRKNRVISMVLSDDMGREVRTGALARAVSGNEEPWTK